MEIKRFTLSAQICEDIIEKVRNQQLAPGSKLIIKAIQDQYGVSSTVARDVIYKLQQRGFVEVSDNVSARLVTLELEDMEDLIAIYEELFRMSYRLIRRNHTEHQVREAMREVYRQELALAEAGAAKAERIQCFVELVNLPGAMTGNRYYKDMISSLLGKWVIGFGSYTEILDPEEALENSRKMMHAMEHEDWDRFQELRFYMTDEFRKALKTRETQ